MKVLVTGATGFLGQEVVRSLLRRGHELRAIVRPDSRCSLSADVDVVRLDLRRRDGLDAALNGVDSVVHAAAAKVGDFHTQFASTVSATENLIDGMRRAGVTQMVLVSSFSVYDYERIPRSAVLNEASPLADAAAARDAYAATKLLQERVVREAAAEFEWSTMVARPGMIFGRDNLWSARLGFGGDGVTWVCIGSKAPLPLTYVGNCADALAHLTEHNRPGVQVVNVLDREQPTQAEYRRELQRRIGHRRTILVPWTVAQTTVGALDRLDAALGRPLHLPTALRLDSAVARWRPIRFSRERLDGLGWVQPTSLGEALDLCTRPVRSRSDAEAVAPFQA